jgi:hypothetical protein
MEPKIIAPRQLRSGFMAADSFTTSMLYGSFEYAFPEHRNSLPFTMIEVPATSAHHGSTRNRRRFARSSYVSKENGPLSIEFDPARQVLEHLAQPHRRF